MSPSNATTGTWTVQLSSGKVSLHKAAAATTSVVNIPVKKDNRPGFEDSLIKSITVSYTVGTAALTSAPTAVLNKNTVSATTGAQTNATVAGTLAFAGTSTNGTEIGSFNATFTVTSPAQIADTDSLILTLTMNEAATSVLDITGVKVDYTG